MLLQCPRCRAVQDDTARTCTKCGEPLTPPSAPATRRPTLPRRFGRSRSDVFHFAEPVPVAEVEQTAILPTPHPLPRPASPAPARRRASRAPAVAAGLALALIVAAFLRFGHALPRLFHGTPRQVALPGGAPTPSDGLTLVTSRPTGHAPVGSAVTVTASLPPAQSQAAHVSLFSQRAPGPDVLFSSAEGSLCSATWTPPAPGRYLLTATVQRGRRQPLLSRSLTVIADAAKAPPASARPRPTQRAVVAQFPRRRTADALANRLQRRGIPAQVRPTLGRNGRPAYQVEVGIHSRDRNAHSSGII